MGRSEQRSQGAPRATGANFAQGSLNQSVNASYNGPIHGTMQPSAFGHHNSYGGHGSQPMTN